MVWEKDHKDGFLFDLVVDNMEVFVKREHVRNLSVRSNEAGEEWAVLQTNLGRSYIIERCDFRKWRLQYIINKIKNVH